MVRENMRKGEEIIEEKSLALSPDDADQEKAGAA
jgi:hypothetical protein